MLTVDRFEGNIAVCIDDAGQPLHISRSALDESVHEGDCIARGDDGIYHCDCVQTQTRRECIGMRLKRLMKLK
ncbi:MAG: DUF3006 domain-containing protein [Clostridia bacterium]